MSTWLVGRPICWRVERVSVRLAAIAFAAALLIASASGCAAIGPKRETRASVSSALAGATVSSGLAGATVSSALAGATLPRHPKPEPEVRLRGAPGRLIRPLVAQPQQVAPVEPPAHLQLVNRHAASLRAAAAGGWTLAGLRVAGRVLVQDLARPYTRQGADWLKELWRHSPVAASSIAAGAVVLSGAAWLAFGRDLAIPLSASATMTVGRARISVSGAYDSTTRQWNGALRFNLDALLNGLGASQGSASRGAGMLADMVRAPEGALIAAPYAP